MELIDTHAHLDEHAFATDCDQTVARAVEAGISAILVVGTTVESSRNSVALAKRYPNAFAAVGIQPNYVADATEEDWQAISELALLDNVVAIGETGLDRYWDYAPIDRQIDYFRRHLRLARERNLPFIVHCREADGDVLEVLRDESSEGSLRGVMHAFSSDQRMAQHCLDLGLHISFAGMVTYKKNESLRSVAAIVPEDRLLLETDSPYLAPTPKRGKRNEPAFVAHTARCVAELRAVSIEELARSTTQNAQSLFGLPLD
jgi:TatD DNase family protein